MHHTAFITKASCLSITAAIFFFIFNSNAAPLDPPHDSGDDFTAGCTTCHDLRAFGQKNLIPDTGHVPTNIDDSQYNLLCWTCHNDTDAPRVETHSSLQTDNGFGDWAVECWVCHNQHTQVQDREQGLEPGTGYGKFIRERIYLTRILDNAPPNGATVVGKTGFKKVKLTGNTGPNSFADGDSSYDGICEVCHTNVLLDHYKNDGSGSDQNHAYVAKLAEKNSNLTTHENCVFCHNHKDGFRPSCPDCHGFPPTVDATSGPEGRVGPDNVRAVNRYDAAPSTTGSSTSGHHDLHATENGYNYPCHTCHYNGMSMTMTANDPDVDNQIQIGFNVEVDDVSSMPAWTHEFINGAYSRCGYRNGTYVKNIDGVDETVKSWKKNCGVRITATNELIQPDDILSRIPELIDRITIPDGGQEYKGQTTLSGYTYEGVLDVPSQTETNIAMDNSTQCSNVYCHRDGKLLIKDAAGDIRYPKSTYPPLYPPDASPPEWNNSAWDPQGDAPEKCNNCHGAWPRYDFHLYHIGRGMDCYYCHYGTVDKDNNIIDKSLHVNGKYDVIPKPEVWIRGEYHKFTMDYIPDVNGGWCMNNSCHQEIGRPDPEPWRNYDIPQELNPPLTWSYTGIQQCSTPADMRSTIQVRTHPGCQDCIADFHFEMNWADGSPIDPSLKLTNTMWHTFSHLYTHTYNPVCDPDDPTFDISSTDCQTNVSYTWSGTVCDPREVSYNPNDPSCDPKCNPNFANPPYDRYNQDCWPIILDHQDRAYDMEWTMADAEGITIPEAPAKRITPVVACPVANEPPVLISFTGAPGPDPDAYDITMTVTARDPDYNKGSHSGNADIVVRFSGTDVTISVPLTNLASSHEITYTFGARATFFISVYIDDNAPEEGAETFGASGLKRYFINKTSVTEM